MGQIIKWSQEEKAELTRIVQSGWDHQFPGYSWVADILNSEFNNNRTCSSVMAMCRKLGV